MATGRKLLASCSICGGHKREGSGPGFNKERLIFQWQDRSLVGWHHHLGARVASGSGALPATSQVVKLFAEVFPELLGEKAVDNRI